MLHKIQTDSPSEVRASSYTTLWKTKKITVKELDKEKLEKLCSERKAYGRKLLATLFLPGRRVCIGTY